MFQLKFACFVLIFVVVFSLTSAKFPDDPKPCKYADSTCILEKINYFIQSQSQGDKSINLLKIDPLSVSKISLSQGVESPVNIDLTFSKNNIVGLTNSVAYKVKGFGKDMTQNHEIHLKVKHVDLVGDYKISGKILILPINGNGKSNMTLIDTDISLYFNGTPLEKNGATYMKINNMKLIADPKRLYYQFENLFNGDKALSDNMNLFLNENWSEIFMEVRESIQDAFARIFEHVINNVFSKYPYDKYFVED